jgi:putative ABC transport system ATP-binding protein
MLQIQNLGKHFGSTPVFDAVSLRLRPGEFVALLGESGVGKSTLLNCIAGLENADRGQVLIQGTDLATLDDAARARLRRQHLGFVFQAFHVLPHLSVSENVALPLLLLGQRGAAVNARVAALLAAVGLDGLGTRFPAQLSGGQLQRVAIARAVAHAPGLILADEPTGNLDPTTAARVLGVLRAQVREAGAACLLVTHSAAAAALADRVLRLTPTGIEAEAAPVGALADAAP